MNRVSQVRSFPAQRGRASALVLGLLIALSVAPLFAEVSVVTDGQGGRPKTVVLTETRGHRSFYWSQVRPGASPSSLLNVRGDKMGDSRPFVAEQPGTHQPWVLWAVSDGHDREIAFATWVGGRWQGPQLLEAVDNPYDDLDPRLSFDASGSPVAVWWRKEPIPRVYMSRYLRGEWTPALPVSDPSVPSRFPSIGMSGNQAKVSFRTPQGLTVLFLDLVAPSVSMDGSGPLDGPVPPPDAADPGKSHRGDGHGGTNPGNGPDQGPSPYD